MTVAALQSLLVSMLLAAPPAPSADVALREGLRAREAKRLTTAARHLESGLSAAPERLDLRYELAVTYAWDARLDDASATLTALLQRAPGHLGARLFMARVAFWRGDPQRARGLYEAVLAERPDAVEAWRGLAAVQRADLELGAAQRSYARVLELSPGDPEAVAGLQAIDETWRVEAAASLGMVRWAAGETSGVASLAVRGRLSPSLSLAGSYRTDAARGVFSSDVGAPREAVRQQLGVTAGLRVSPSLAVDLGYSAALDADADTHRLQGRLGVALFESLGASLGVRAGRRDDGRVEGLGDLGLQLQPSPDFWVMGQLYLYADTAGTTGWTTVATAWWSFAPGLSLRASAGAGRTAESPTASAALGLSWALSPKQELRASFEAMWQPVERWAPTLTWVQRW